MTLPNNSIIKYDIVIQAKDAIASLQKLSKETEVFNAKVSQTAAAVQSMSSKWGMSTQSVVSLLKGFDTQITSAGKSSLIFGQLGQQGWTDVTKSINSANNALGGFGRGIDVVRIALGTLVAQIIFQITNQIGNAIRLGIKSVQDMEGAIYNLANAEKVLSQQGIEISPKDLQNTITELQKIVPTLSKIDATKAVSSIALFTKELGYTKEQITELSTAIGILYIRNRSLGLSFEQVRSQVLTSILTGRSQGIRDLGVTISDTSIKAEALRLGLVKNETEFNKLTGDVLTQVKALATLSIINKSVADEQKNSESRQTALTDATGKLTAKWQDFLMVITKLITPALISFMDMFSSRLSGFIDYMDKFKQKAEAVGAIIAGITAVYTEFYGATSLKNAIDSMLNPLNAFKKGAGDALQYFRSFENGADTATTKAKELAAAIDGISGTNLDSLVKDVESFARRMEELNQKFRITTERDEQDFRAKLTRAQEDYQLDVQRTIEDFNNRRHNLEQQYRSNEKNAEARFQQELKELREKYLFNLEDALRARDARQVIRLMEQYRMDKENITSRFNLEQDQRRKQYRQELADLKRQEAQKLAEMAQAEKIKEQRMIEDFNIARARKLQDYLQQKAELEQAWNDRLKLEAQKLAEQFGLNESQTKRIYELLRRYYGPNGFIDRLYDYSYKSLVLRSQNLLTALQAMISSFVSTVNSVTPVLGGGIIGGGGFGISGGSQGSGGAWWKKNKAEGGVDIVNSPTTTSYGATYGEAGPEAHIFLPLGGSSSGVQTIASSLPSLGGGKMSIELLLSPDLEARIVGNTMGRTADVIMRTLRSK